MSFNDLGLNEKTIQAIADSGYEEPTAVQKDVIPSILAGKDIFTIAPASSGKTCAYIFPLIDIISKKQGQTILIIAADSKESVNISDKFSVFNKYHEAGDSEETTENTFEANVIIGTPSLLLENIAENQIDVTNVNILVVDDINLIKKKRQLANLNKILELLPENKQNIVFTTRRSKETENTLNKILKTPAEIKVNKTKEPEAQNKQEPLPAAEKQDLAPETKPRLANTPKQDKKALDLAKKYKTFGKKTPAFLLVDSKLAAE